MPELQKLGDGVGTGKRNRKRLKGKYFVYSLGACGLLQIEVYLISSIKIQFICITRNFFVEEFGVTHSTDNTEIQPLLTHPTSKPVLTVNKSMEVYYNGQVVTRTHREVTAVLVI